MHANSQAANAVAVTLADTHEQQVPLESNHNEVHVSTTPKLVVSNHVDVKFVAPVNSNVLVSETAWIIGDAEGMPACVSALVRKGIQVAKAWTLNDLRCSKLRRDILNEMRSQPPQWIWLNVTNEVYKWGGEDGKRLSIMLSSMIRLQLDSPRHLVLQGAITNTRGWHPERFEKLFKHPRLFSASVRWCALNIQVEPNAQTCFYSRVFATIQIPVDATLCCNKTRKSKLKVFPQVAWDCYHSNLVDLLLPNAFVGPAVKKSKPKVPFREGIDGPGEHADSQGLTPEPARRKKYTSDSVENHFDDCGDDCSAITVQEAFSCFETATDSTDCPCSEIDFNSESEEMFDNQFYCWAMPGSDYEGYNPSERPYSSHHDNIHNVLLALDSRPGIHDVAELFGGDGNTINLSIKRKLVGGRNFDLTTNINLLDESEVAGLWKYLIEHAPRVVVVAPPCTAFGPWSYINRKRNPAGYFQARRVGKKLADLAADVCLYQLYNGRHFIAENPRTSQLWDLESWKEVLRHSVSVVLDQCSVGLKDPTGVPTLKPTLIVASDWTLIKRLNRRCSGQHTHAQLAGSVDGISRCRYAQVWPRKMIELIVDGIEELLHKKISMPVFPAARFSCPGCRAHVARHDPRHDRGEDCKFPYDDSIQWSCAACQVFKPSNASGHSYEYGDCQWAEARTRQRTVAQPRVPRVPTHAMPAEPSEEQLNAESHAVPEAPANMTWIPVVNLEIVTRLDQVRIRDGWHHAQHNISLVINHARACRTCEPRLNAQIWKWRSTFAFYPDYSHAHGSWFQLEDHVEFTTAEYHARTPLPEHAPILVHVFHDQLTAPPTENKTRTADLPTPQNVNPFAQAIQEWDDEEARGTSSSSSSRPAAGVRLGGAAEPVQGDIPEPVPPEVNHELGEDIPVPEPDWSSWDLGRMLRKLRSDTPGVRIHALRKLHARWFHCSSTRMTGLLKAAGVGKEIIDQIPGIIDTCKACRSWKRPAPKAVASSRLTTQFNDVLQCDLLFTSNGIVIHVIDEAVRFTMTGILENRSTYSILDWLTQSWIRIFGAPRVILSDQEGGLCSEEASIWAERHNVQLKFRPKNSHATTVERHHQILRDQINKIRSQVAEEKLDIPFAHIVAEATFAKNTLTLIGGYSPYQAVFGYTPRYLAELETPNQSEINDSEGGLVGLSRHAIRLREIALESIISATARARMQRADQSKSRLPAQAADYQTGEAVDVWRQPSQKDLTGWRGPCTIVSTHDADQGYLDIKWQGRVMSARLQDIRRSLSLFVGLVDDGDQPTKVVHRYLQSLKNPSIQVLAWVETPSGWQLSKAAQENTEVYQALRHVAHNTFGLSKCFGARVGRGPAVLSGVVSALRSIIVWWPVGQPSLYHTVELAADQRCDLRSLFEKEVDTCWIQFIDASTSSARQIRRRIPEDPYQDADPRNPNVPRDMSDADTLIAPSPVTSMSTATVHSPIPSSRGMPPPPPPPAPFLPRNRVPVESTHSRSSRGPSVHSSTPSTNPPVPPPSGNPPEKRLVNTDHNKGPPHKIPHTFGSNTPASSSWQNPSAAPPQPVHPPSVAPQLPIHEPGLDLEDDISSLNSTIPYEEEQREEDAYFQVWNHLETHFSSEADWFTRHYFAAFEEDYVPLHTHPPVFWIQPPSRSLAKDEFCVYDVVEQTQVIEKEYDELTAAEVKQNRALVEEAIRKELSSFSEHKCFKPVPKGSIPNVLTNRWLFRWKVIDGKKSVKARLVVHGFKDTAAASLSTFANTTSRWGQRLINSVATQRKWRLRSADIGTAFLQGLTFKQLAELTGEPLRVVGFQCPKGTEPYMKELAEFKHLNFDLWDLQMIKAIYGLKDAPRAWRKRLDQIFKELGGHSLNIDQAIYVWHDSSGLICIVSTHVDDLKFAGTETFVVWFLGQLEIRVGTLKLFDAFNSSFEHCGIMHCQESDYSVVTHQNHYAARLHPADVSNLDVTKPLELLTQHYIDLYLSLLGGLSWLVQTRQDVCIYVCALQRCAKAPTTENILRLNKVCRWVRRIPSFIRYECLVGPVKILTIADSAFRKEDASGLAMKGAIIGIAEHRDSTVATGTGKPTCDPGGRLHAIEWYSRRQRRIARSTFAAELHSLVDGVEVAKVVLQAMLEITSAVPLLPAAITRILDSPQEREVNIQVCTDCKSLFDTLAVEDVKAPNENALVMLLLSVKESLQTGLISKMYWIDTRDMLADALNKGVVARSALLVAGKTGKWLLQYESKVHFEKQLRKITTAAEEIQEHMQ